MEKIITRIPHEEYRKNYTLFSKGFIYKEEVKDKFTEFTYFSNTCVILFYFYKNHRRAYITYPVSSSIFSLIRLPYVDNPVAFVAELRGHQIDRMEASLYNLEKIGLVFYTFSPAFFLSLAALTEKNKSNKTNLELLFEKYNKKSQLIKKLRLSA